MANQFLVNVDFGKNQVLNPVIHNATADLSSPVAGQLYYNSNDNQLRLRDSSTWQILASRSYVDSTIQGLDTKESVKVATTANITSLSDGAPDTLDGVSLNTGDRVLVKDQTTASENGIYEVISVGTGSDGSWQRAVDADTSEDLNAGGYTFVTEGAVHGDSGWVISSDDPITLDTDDITWVQFSGAGQISAGDGLIKSGNVINAQGTTDRIDVFADTIDISSNYVGQNTINTLGTVSTGTWQASTVDIAYGGTGNTTFTTNRLISFDGSKQVSSSLDPSVITRKFSQSIGDGSATSFSVNHGLATEDLEVSVIETGGNREKVYPEVRIVDTNNVQVNFASAPASTEFKVIVMG